MLHLFGPSLEARVYMNYKFYAMFVCVNNEVARLGQSIHTQDSSLENAYDFSFAIEYYTKTMALRTVEVLLVVVRREK